MHVPRRFLLGLACGFVLAVASFVAMLYTQLGISTNSGSWADDIIKRKVALAAATPGPRLLLIGGSGTTFGLKAGLIEKETGVHTLNMGTHAGLGLDLIIHWAETEARPGDTVLIVPEYELYVAKSPEEAHDDYILAHDPGYFREMSLWDKIAMATRIPFKRLQKGWHNKKHPEPPPRPHPPYTDGASFIDANGDETGNHAADKPLHSPNMDLHAPLLEDGLTSDDGHGFNLIRDFVAWAKAHKVRVLATWPNIIHRPEYDGSKADLTIKTISHFYDSLGVGVVGNARDAMLPYDDFFDTVYHPTYETTVVRTEKLIPALKPFLNVDGSK
jgi:hypothetical protein